MLYFNYHAIGFAALGLVSMLMFSYFVPNEWLSALVGLAVAGGADYVFRWRSRLIVESEDADEYLWNPDIGGHVWFIPIWLIASFIALGVGVFGGLALFNYFFAPPAQPDILSCLSWLLQPDSV